MNTNECIQSTNEYENPRARLAALEDSLAALGGLAVAFSGGVDSTFLLAVAHRVLGDRAMAFTCRSPFVSEWEFTEAADYCDANGIAHQIVDVNPLADDHCRNNEPDRCYWCKLAIFGAIKEAAAGCGLTYVADGSNIDDDGDYRPGMRAVRELGILSPLRQAGMTKSDIRELSREMGLPTADKPAYACLASRIAYNEEITPDKLARIEAAENFLTSMGFTALRVRMHGDIARIELPADQIERAASPECRTQITDKLFELGFTYVTLDLAGYKTGSMNKAIK